MTQSAAPSRGLHIGLWVVQVLLALAFGMAGLFKLSTSGPDLVAAGMAWAGRYSDGTRLLIGGSEFLAAVGLILPSALRIMPRLTAVAAGGLVLVMVLAAVDHGTNGEMENTPVNLIMGSMAALVAWGRWVGAPIKSGSK